METAKYYSSIFLLLLWTISCHPIRHLNKEIKRLGYITYTTPLEFAGTGTLIGGGPKQLNIVASPDSCFPDEIDDVATNLRKVDNTTIPTRQWKITTQGNINIDLINFLSSGNAMLGAGIGFSKVQTMSLTMNGVHIEYLDSIRLTEFYTNQMNDTCREYLDRVGFIIQALKVDSLEFKFYDETGGNIKLSVDNIKEILEIGFDIQFSIEDGTTLLIETPKYIGYQLGRLKKSDEGIALFRASKTRRNKFIFKTLEIFDEDEDENTVESFMNENVILKSLDHFEEIDSHSLYK
ncbi:MAG: hypothetical protein HOJ35_05030 [Bdellovibrionales bacterium]|nr:hypothetical protein [Bdellovibrionales bacterium]